MPDKPKILKTDVVAESRLFKIQQVDLRFTNGEERQFERLKPGMRGAVLIVPMLDNQTVLLVREYAVGLERYELGLPKGLMEPGETPEDAANRELQEEIGYGARKLTPLHALSLAPGYMSHTTQVVLAQSLYENKLPGDEPEPLEVVPWRLDDFPALLGQDNFTEARSIASLYMVRDYLR